jgi:hypothetical protein
MLTTPAKKQQDDPSGASPAQLVVEQSHQLDHRVDED